MSADPRQPVIVGVAQATWRGGDAPSPIELCAEVVNAAAHDAGATALLQRAGALAVVDIASRRWNDPAALVAARLGIEPRETLRSNIGGDGPQVLVSALATRIADGELDVAIVCGAEALATVGRALREQRELPWEPVDDGVAPTTVLGSDRAPATAAETDANLIAPIVMYPLFENALWAREGTTLDEHRARLGELWAGFSRVAATNPYAWSPQERTAAGDRDARSGQPARHAALHEAAELEHPDRPGGGADPLLGGRRASSSGSRATAGSTRSPPGTPTTTGSSASARTCARHRRSASPRAQHWPRPASGSTTSRTSTSTRASPARCRSRAGSSASTRSATRGR